MAGFVATTLLGEIGIDQSGAILIEVRITNLLWVTPL